MGVGKGRWTMTTRVVVIGAGVGGLTTAALLAQAGCDVTVLEGETYPGGCAGTFFHKGYRFDAGATVAGGFQPNGPHALVGEQLGIDWKLRHAEEAWVVHLPGCSVTQAQDRTDVLAQFPASRAFWEAQARAADLCWSMAAQGLPWLPTTLAEAVQIAKTGLSHFPADVRLLPLLTSSVRDVLARYGAADDAAFVRFIDAQLLISAQTTSEHANALYGVTALDLPRQGVVHVEGSIGGIAETLAQKVCDFGGKVLYRKRVVQIAVENGRATGVYAQTGKHSKAREFFAADVVVGNVTPWSLNELLGEASPVPLRREVAQRKAGWGAFSLHVALDASVLPPNAADHHQFVTEMQGAMGEGRTIFLSLSPEWDKTRAPAGFRAATLTTHTAVQQWWDLVGTDAYEQRKADYTERMLAAVENVLPGFRRGIQFTMPGTPVTYQSYTSRYKGMVGGFAQTSLFGARTPRTGVANVLLVGDSIFPGQSTAGVTLGAMRVFRNIQGRLVQQG